jgi:hypothetical protein
LLEQGGLVEVEKKNKKKVEILYNAIDESNWFFRCPVEKSLRSLILYNATFHLFLFNTYIFFSGLNLLSLAHSFDFAQLRDFYKVSNSYFYSPLPILYILNFNVVWFLWFMICVMWLWFKTTNN